MVEREPQTTSLEGWIDALDRADADLAGGRVVNGTTIHAELRASIMRMERGETPASANVATAN